MKVLIVSTSPFRDDNNIGNSYKNIFEGIDGLEVAHICCGSGTPNTDFFNLHFHINERNIIRNLLKPDYPSGIFMKNKDEKISLNDSSESKLIKFVKIYRFQIFFWLRDVIWSFKNWLSPELEKFIDDYKPDLIFAPFLDTGYLNEMLIFLCKEKNIPLVVYAWDDVYTLKQFSLSPLYWINRLFQRRKLRRVATLSKEFYVISDLQKKEYSKVFNRECKLLYKGYDFKGEYKVSNNVSEIINLVFTGNISSGRWKTISIIGKTLDKINNNKENTNKAKLTVYTSTPMSAKMKKALDSRSIILKDPVPNKEIGKIQEEADILLHVESFKLKDRLQVRLSFSTKIVDYFYKQKCIFAVGPHSIASMEYLAKNDAAILATDINEIEEKLNMIVNKKGLFEEYSKKSWICGSRNHQIKNIQKDLMNDFKRLLNMR